MANIDDKIHYSTVIVSVLNQTIKVKRKVFICSPDIPVNSSDLSSFTPRHRNSLFHALISLWRKQRLFTVPIFVPPGTHHCWVKRSGVDSKLPQGFRYDQLCGNRTPDPLISGPMPQLFSHALLPELNKLP